MRGAALHDPSTPSRHNDAAELYTELIRRNPENHSYYRGLEAATRAESADAKLAMYAKLREQYPRAAAPQRLPLDIASGPAFRELVSPYLQKALRKGVPPLFVDVRPLYRDAEKARAIEEVCKEFNENLRSPAGSFEAGGPREPATALLWLMYFLAQHHDHRGEHERALEIVDEAIAHTPTLIELMLVKGKIYKVGQRTQSISRDLCN